VTDIDAFDECSICGHYRKEHDLHGCGHHTWGLRCKCDEDFYSNKYSLKEAKEKSDEAV
jgi:hypothetical protein